MHDSATYLTLTLPYFTLPPTVLYLIPILTLSVPYPHPLHLQVWSTKAWKTGP